LAGEAKQQSPNFKKREGHHLGKGGVNLSSIDGPAASGGPAATGEQKVRGSRSARYLEKSQREYKDGTSHGGHKGRKNQKLGGDLVGGGLRRGVGENELIDDHELSINVGGQARQVRGEKGEKGGVKKNSPKNKVGTLQVGVKSPGKGRPYQKRIDSEENLRSGKKGAMKNKVDRHFLD